MELKLVGQASATSLLSPSLSSLQALGIVQGWQLLRASAISVDPAPQRGKPAILVKKNLEGKHKAITKLQK